jgi:hypothetical protein
VGLIKGKGDFRVLTITKWVCRREAKSVRLARESALPFIQECACNATFGDVYIRTCVRVEKGEFVELDGRVGGRARCDVKVVGKSMSGVGCCGFCGVCVSGDNTWTVASATNVSHRRNCLREKVKRKWERVSPCRVPRFMSIDGVEP